LAYLLQFNTSDPLDINLDISSPLACYAAANWITHAHSGGKNKSQSSSLFTLMMKLFTDKNGAFENWVRICDKDCFGMRHLQKKSNDIAKPLYYASVAGLSEVSYALLEMGADVNAQGGKYGNALQAALYEGHQGIAKLLIEKGADVNAQEGKYGNALQVASVKGYEAIAKLLLEKGADINAQQGYFGNTLQATPVKGHEAIANLLLEKGADDTFKNVKFTSSSKLDTENEVEPPTNEFVIGKHFVIGAESTLKGIQAKEMAVEAAFNNINISRLEYAILAGFNEALLRSGTGYLPEIHIFCSVDIAQTAESFVTKLGKILSPLPGALFTPSSVHWIPVFKHDKTILSWDEFAFSCTERYADIRSAVAPTSIQVVSCPQGSWSNGGTSATPSGFSGNELKGSDSDKKDTDDAGDNEGEDNKSGDREGDDDNPDDKEPDDPTNGSSTSVLPVVSFDAQAKVYANAADTISPKVFQELHVNGRLIIQVSYILFYLPEI
jgi:hypothetical protein